MLDIVDDDDETYLRTVLSRAMTTPTCHLTLPLASASLPIFFLCALHPFYTIPHSFYHFPPTTVLPHPFWPFSCASATFPHHFRFGTCFLCFSTLPTLYFIFIDPSAHFCWYLTIRTFLHLFVYMFQLLCMFLFLPTFWNKSTAYNEGATHKLKLRSSPLPYLVVSPHFRSSSVHHLPPTDDITRLVTCAS